MDQLPAFTVRENPRAKRILLKVSLHHGLVVVIPRGFSRKGVLEIIQEKRAWIERAFRKLEQQAPLPVEPRELPTAVHLAAISQDFTIEYTPAPTTPLVLYQITPVLFRITGDCEDLEGCRHLLKHWLKYQGRVHLLPWLHRLSEQVQLPYRQARIRGQKSLWGSCSVKGDINLNCNLLFLRPELVRYLLLHELCHTVHFNHSENFYQLLAELEPDHLRLRAEMKQAWQQVPWWAL